MRDIIQNSILILFLVIVLSFSIEQNKKECIRSNGEWTGLTCEK